MKNDTLPVKKRICHLCPSFNNPIYMHLVNEQFNMGYWVRVFYFRKTGTGLPNGDKDYVDGCNPYNALDRFLFFTKEYKLIKAFFKQYNKVCFDLIHAHTLFVSGYIAYRINRVLNIPYIVAVRGSDINIFFKYRILLRKTGIKVMKNADKIIFISPLQKKQVLERYVPHNIVNEISRKINVIPNGIDEIWFQNRPSIPKKKDVITAIYFGDINRNKNIGSTIMALDLLEKEHYNVTFIVIGKIHDKSYINLIKSRSYIEYHPEMLQTQLIKYVNRANVFIMVSKSETFGLSYIEAMSQGVPVIYTKGQGFDGYFKDGFVGKHVDPSKPREIAEAVKIIFKNYEFMSNNCIQMSRKFVWREIAKEYRTLYDDIWREKNEYK